VRVRVRRGNRRAEVESIMLFDFFLFQFSRIWVGETVVREYLVGIPGVFCLFKRRVWDSFAGQKTSVFAKKLLFLFES
jgi:hypothetical protein